MSVEGTRPGHQSRRALRGTRPSPARPACAAARPSSTQRTHTARFFFEAPATTLGGKLLNSRKESSISETT